MFSNSALRIPSKPLPASLARDDITSSDMGGDRGKGGRRKEVKMTGRTHSHYLTFLTSARNASKSTTERSRH
jgi:hypothetical protein